MEHMGGTFAATENSNGPSTCRRRTDDGLTSTNDQIEPVTLSKEHLKRENESVDLYDEEGSRREAARLDDFIRRRKDEKQTLS